MTIVETAYGKVEGSHRAGVHSFKGVPFAAPPVGERRWRAPQAPMPWAGVRPATAWGKQAWQPAVENAGMLSFVFNAQNAAYRDEDCLVLNVFTPACDAGKRPVLVWIHGGGFAGGTGGTTVYDGSTLARRGDVVVVTINYRVGPLGFLHLNELTGGRIPATGNEGLLDQLQALDWVRKNVAGFGGDADNVTIFGESAGAMSVGALLACAPARGLFHRAMLLSGAASTANPLDRAVEVADGLLRRAGITLPDDVDRLLALEPEALIEAASGYRAAGGGMTFQPCIDGELLTALPLDSVRDGSADGIPILVGTQRDEWRTVDVGIDHDVLASGVNAANEVQDSFAENNNRTSPKVTLTWRPADDWLFYGTWSHGFRPGVVNDDLVRALVDLEDLRAADPRAEDLYQQLFDQQVTEGDEAYNYEIGAKATIADGRLSFTSALYFIDWESVIINTSAMTPDIQGLVPFPLNFADNVGSAESQGLELEIQGQLTDSLRWTLGGNWMWKAEIGTAAAGNTARVAEARTVDIVPGNRLPSSPETTGYGSLALGRDDYHFSFYVRNLFDDVVAHERNQVGYQFGRARSVGLEFSYGL